MVIDLQLQLSNLILLVQNMCENNETQKDEMNKLKFENGNLKQKIASLEDRNCDLRKLIETMSEGQITSTCPPSSDFEGDSWVICKIFQRQTWNIVNGLRQLKRRWNIRNYVLLGLEILKYPF